MAATTAALPGTASVPPVQKSYCTSTTSSAERMRTADCNCQLKVGGNVEGNLASIEEGDEDDPRTLLNSALAGLGHVDPSVCDVLAPD